MPDITITIQDTLKENTQRAISELKEAIIIALNAENDLDIADFNDNGGLDQIADDSTPVYTKEINDSWYLYSLELTSAALDLGLDEPVHNTAAPIYQYIHNALNEWVSENKEEITNGMKLINNSDNFTIDAIRKIECLLPDKSESEESESD